MTINELIERLEKLRNEYGDTDVFIVDSDEGGWRLLAEVSTDTIHGHDGVLLFDNDYW